MDEKAIVNLYNTFSPGITRYLKSKLPEDEVDEILNDVFIEVVDSMPRLKKEENLKAWIYKIAHNEIVDFYRKRKIKSFLLSQMPYLELFAKEINQPEFVMEKNQIRARIESTMRQLAQKYQQILRMHYEEQIPVKKIALVLNISPKATESLLYRARQQFMKKYERT